jgi:hypothetical protein
MKILVCTIFALLIVTPNLICAQIQQNRTPRFPVPNSRGVFPFRKKANKTQKKQLEPKAEDLSKYSQFLAQPKTGIFRLLPDSGCEENMLVVNAKEDCLKAIPDSSYYSFREIEHTHEAVADIRLKNNFLITDGVLAHGIMVNLGDVMLDQILLGDASLIYLRNYQPKELGKDALKQHNELQSGIKLGRYEYRSIHPAQENSTYVLRVIAYKGNIFRSFRGFTYDLLEGDKRIDLTVAFRIIRRESDGSVTLLWKELERRKSPKLKIIKKKQ